MSDVYAWKSIAEIEADLDRVVGQIPNYIQQGRDDIAEYLLPEFKRDFYQEIERVVGIAATDVADKVLIPALKDATYPHLMNRKLEEAQRLMYHLQPAIGLVVQHGIGMSFERVNENVPLSVRVDVHFPRYDRTTTGVVW